MPYMIPLPPKFLKRINMGLVDVGSRSQKIRCTSICIIGMQLMEVLKEQSRIN
jgi:hypothetical protein